MEKRESKDPLFAYLVLSSFLCWINRFLWDCCIRLITAGQSTWSGAGSHSIVKTAGQSPLGSGREGQENWSGWRGWSSTVVHCCLPNASHFLGHLKKGETFPSIWPPGFLFPRLLPLCVLLLCSGYNTTRLPTSCGRTRSRVVWVTTTTKQQVATLGSGNAAFRPEKKSSYCLCICW
jgi:hypothetical protein